LKISGNIVASGNINFNNTTAINYEGKGSLLSAGSISLNNNRLIPNNFSAITFPFSNNLMALVATTDINLNLSSSSGGNRTAPDVAILAISGNRATVASGKFIRGAILGKEIYSGANSEIYYENGIAEVLPGNLPVPSYFLLSQNWKEVPNS
jgi:hypothetical protein